MKVIVDNKIPYIKGKIEQIADEVVYLPGDGFTHETVQDADALVVRTRTRCSRSLLQGSKVRFIATATIGFDHIDTAYLKEAGIEWMNCPGCNSHSVEQYVHAALVLLQRYRGLEVQDATLGVVGVGHVGSLIVKLGEELGMNVLQCDPPRADIEEPFSPPEENNDENKEGNRNKKTSQDQKPRKFVSLNEIAEQCDIISFHTPLVRQGIHPTYHLANKDFFSRLRCHPIIINTSRGEVIDTQALIYALQNFQIRDAVIDTWENEPYISLNLLERVYLGTPHIAGYSADGKARATQMALNALCKFFHIDKEFEVCPPDLPHPVDKKLEGDERLLAFYNPLTDSQALKSHPEQFEYFRGNYPLRREKD